MFLFQAESEVSTTAEDCSSEVRYYLFIYLFIFTKHIFFSIYQYKKHLFFKHIFSFNYQVKHVHIFT